MNFLVQGYCHSCRQKYSNKGKQVLGLGIGAPSQETVIGARPPVDISKDTWITVPSRGQGRRWSGRANNTISVLQQQRPGNYKKQAPLVSKKANHMLGSQSPENRFTVFKRIPLRTATTSLPRGIPSRRERHLVRLLASRTMCHLAHHHTPAHYRLGKAHNP